MEHGLDTCINANGGTLRVLPGMIATAVEAILGAVERDGGLDKLTQLMGHLGLTQHALIASVTFYHPTPLHHICRSAASYLLDLLGPSVVAVGCLFIRSPWAPYAFQDYRPG